MNHFFSKLTGVLIIVFAALVFYSVDTTKKLHKSEELSESLECTISGLSQKIEAYEVRINDSTTLHAATVRTLRMTVENIQSRYNDLLSATKTRKKDVNQISSVGTVSRDTVIVPTYIDSFGGMKTGYKDDFIDISVNIDKHKLATIAYSSKDSLTMMITQKKHSILFGLIKWKSYEKSTVINHNPKATITSLEIINVIE